MGWFFFFLLDLGLCVFWGSARRGFAAGPPAGRRDPSSGGPGASPRLAPFFLLFFLLFSPFILFYFFSEQDLSARVTGRFGEGLGRISQRGQSAGGAGVLGGAGVSGGADIPRCVGVPSGAGVPGGVFAAGCRCPGGADAPGGCVGCCCPVPGAVREYRG